MDWKMFFMVFGTVFLAELGDKTQLATVLYSSQSKSPVMIFLAAALALVLSTLLATALGQVLEKFLPPKTMTGIAGVAFVIIGVLLVGSVLRPVR